jgi:hypothetical protein
MPTLRRTLNSCEGSRGRSIAGDALPNIGHHLVASATRCHLSTAILASGSGATSRRRRLGW